MAYKMNMSPKEERASQRLFGTDGVRGVANVHPMTAEVAMQLGRALAYLIRNGPHRHRVIVGKDTRLSGYMLEQALAAGIISMGVDVWLTGPLPTPGISNLTTSMRADAGAVISASHNPYQDNGIKFFWRDGFKLPDETEARIEALMSDGSIDDMRPTATQIGGAKRLDDAGGRYIVFLKNTFPRELTLEGLTVVTSVFFFSSLRRTSSPAQIAMIASPSTTSPFSSTTTSRSASPSSARPSCAPCFTTARARFSGYSAPHRALMFLPSGSMPSLMTLAPSSSSTAGATL